MIGNTPSIETSETDTAGASMTRRSSSGGLLSPEVELGGNNLQYVSFKLVSFKFM